MMSKLCLLITDDADDHHAFFEALIGYEKTIVLNVLDSQMALEFLKTQKYIPDIIFIDLTMHGVKINTFLKTVQRELAVHPLKIVVYGEAIDFVKIENTNGLTFFDKDYEYTGLKKFLADLVSP